MTISESGVFSSDLICMIEIDSPEKNRRSSVAENRSAENVILNLRSAILGYARTLDVFGSVFKRIELFLKKIAVSCSTFKTSKTVLQPNLIYYIGKMQWIKGDFNSAYEVGKNKTKRKKD